MEELRYSLGKFLWDDLEALKQYGFDLSLVKDKNDTCIIAIGCELLYRFDVNNREGVYKIKDTPFEVVHDVTTQPFFIDKELDFGGFRSLVNRILIINGYRKIKVFGDYEMESVDISPMNVRDVLLNDLPYKNPESITNTLALADELDVGHNSVISSFFGVLKESPSKYNPLCYNFYKYIVGDTKGHASSMYYELTLEQVLEILIKRSKPRTFRTRLANKKAIEKYTTMEKPTSFSKRLFNLFKWE